MSKIDWENDKRKRNVALRGSGNDHGDPTPVEREAWIALRKKKPAPKKDVKPNYSVYPPGALLRCPHCANSVKADRMSNHINQQHPVHKRLMTCKYCSLSLLPKTMRKHIASQHPVVRSANSYPCPKCKMMVESIKVHLSEVHRIELDTDGSMLISS